MAGQLTLTQFMGVQISQGQLSSVLYGACRSCPNPKHTEPYDSTLWPYRISASTVPSHGIKMGSIPIRAVDVHGKK